jgi:DNA phosphorothioation-dependent restriction protein DptG
MMHPIPENIIPTDENKLDSYFPLRSKGNDFDWAVVTGIVLSYVLGCQLKNYSMETFRQECTVHFSRVLEDENFWPVLDRMYFSTSDVLNISPLFLLFKAQYKNNGRTELGAANWRMGALFASLLGQQLNESDIPQDLNFLESEILKVLISQLEPTPDKLFAEEYPYLPYLASKFKEDIHFLANHPKYLLEHLENTLKLYAFSYCSQLALNIKSWKEIVPSSRPLYFILDSEKASAERSLVRHHGYKMFSNASEYLFPILSALEVLQVEGPKRPLWKVYQECLAYAEKDSVLSELNTYLAAFRKRRKLVTQPGSLSIESVFDELMKSATEQFRDENTKRSDVNRKYMNALEDQIGADFIVHRGRAGNVLVLNQEQLVLLTNLAIGINERLRLHELINSFEERGFFLDSQSQQVLVSFYERMGNIEKMSDSGDAVYVRKTI